MNITVNFGDSLNIYGIALFCVLGYFNGYLFRDIGLYKIIALFFVIPFCIDLLVRLNIVMTATLPFLIFALIGFWGLEKTKNRILDFIDFTRDQIDRLR